MFENPFEELKTNVWRCRICGEMAEVNSPDGTFCWRCWSEFMGGDKADENGNFITIVDLVKKYGVKPNAKT